jgi:hypothetical protein
VLAVEGWPVSAALLNILIGLVTSVLSGGSVLAWRHVKDARILSRKAAFFGHWQKPGSTSHDDVQAMAVPLRPRPAGACPDCQVHSCTF